MKRSPLKRKTPLRRASPKRSKELALYRKERDAYLMANPNCAARHAAGITCSGDLQLHHYRGRVGRLLRMDMFWLSVCAAHHSFIHDHPGMARELGLLAPRGEFNTVPKPLWEDRPR